MSSPAANPALLAQETESIIQAILRDQVYCQIHVNQMSNLVANFLINPVLRQARRFSGNTVLRIDPVTNQHTRQEIISRNEELIAEAPAPIDTASAIDDEGSVSGRPLVASPIQEDGELWTLRVQYLRI
jgi:hypothetical protein